MNPSIYLSLFIGWPAVWFVILSLFTHPAELFGLVLSGSLQGILIACGPLLAIVLFSRMAWRLLPPQQRSPSPNAAFLLFIPVFNVFWLYRMLYRLGTVVRDEANSLDPKPEVAEAIPKAFCHLGWIAWLLIVIPGLAMPVGPSSVRITAFVVPMIVGGIVATVWVLSGILMFTHISKVISRIANEKTGCEAGRGE